jgi:polar amino acid transport system substrate-binding protein
MWNRWLGPDTEFKLTRDEHVQPISAITFTPIP